MLVVFATLGAFLIAYFGFLSGYITWRQDKDNSKPKSGVLAHFLSLIIALCAGAVSYHTLADKGELTYAYYETNNSDINTLPIRKRTATFDSLSFLSSMYVLDKVVDSGRTVSFINASMGPDIRNLNSSLLDESRKSSGTEESSYYLLFKGLTKGYKNKRRIEFNQDHSTISATTIYEKTMSIISMEEQVDGIYINFRTYDKCKKWPISTTEVCLKKNEEIYFASFFSVDTNGTTFYSYNESLKMSQLEIEKWSSIFHNSLF